MRTESFRWGILGAGNIAVKFCDAVNGIADCTVAAVGVMTTRLAGGMFSPYKGILPACARKAH